MRWRAAVVALTMIAPSIKAQVVRGVVTERVSALALSGVLVSIASASDSMQPGGVRYTLTNASGEYALRVPSAGRYVVSAKRIGVVRYTTDEVTLRAGETLRIDVMLDAFEHKLPVINVNETGLCFRRNDQRQQIVALWDEVRTALLATGVSRDERLVSGWLSRYSRTLEPRSLRILDDRRSVAEGVFDRPMQSIGGDSLAKVGYWRKQDGDTLVFYGPDEEALLSAGFRLGHCFELIRGSAAPRGLIGLGFRPRYNRPLGGIEGTVWIDAGNFELRFVEFRYTNLLTIPSNPHLGGQVHYLRHPTGAWLVRRWFIRMPLFPEVTKLAVARAGGRGEARAAVWRVLEDGAGLFTPGLRSWEKPGTIIGMITDSSGQKPLVGTMVSLSGTPYAVEVDSLGSFRFDSIPPGAYTLLASHPIYAGLGQLADDEPLTLDAGKVYRANLRAISSGSLLEVLCGEKKIEPGSAVLRIQTTNMQSGDLLPKLPVWLRWSDPTQKVSIDPVAPRSIFKADGTDAGEKYLGMETMTDGEGAAVFCGVPSYRSLELFLVLPGDEPTVPRGARVSRVTSFYLFPGELTSRTVKVSPPK